MSNLPPVLQVISDHLDALTLEREALVARIVEIDDQLSKVAQQLGIDNEQLLALTQAPNSMPRLIREDRRSVGTMSSAMLQILLNADRGYSRTELKAELQKVPKFKEQLEGNLNSFYNNVMRYVRSGKIIQIDTLLYHPDRAPLPEGEEDVTGKHLPANVSSLFGPQQRRVSDGSDLV